MKTTIKCNEDFMFNERNAVDIYNDSKVGLDDEVVVLDSNDNILYNIKVSNMKTPQDKSISPLRDNTNATIFVGEPVLDLMLNVDGTAEYVPGGQALSQAVAFKNANPYKQVIFVGNFGCTNNELDENGKIVSNFLEDMGIIVKKIIVPDKKTRTNYVVVDDNGRTILNPVKEEEKPVVTRELAIKTVYSILNEYRNISSIGVDGSLKDVIDSLIGIGLCSYVEVDAGRKTLEQQLEVQDIHNIFSVIGEYKLTDNKLHIVTSKSYANMLIGNIPELEGYKLIEPEDGVVTDEIIKNNAELVRYIKNFIYPNASLGVTIGGCGCFFVDDENRINYLSSYTPDDTKGEKFKDNSAGDTFHALLLSALQDGYSTLYAYQYATIGTSIAGYGTESTAKMNTPNHSEIVRILEEENPFYEYVMEDGTVTWYIGEKRNIKSESKVKTLENKHQ